MSSPRRSHLTLLLVALAAFSLPLLALPLGAQPPGFDAEERGRALTAAFLAGEIDEVVEALDETMHQILEGEAGTRAFHEQIRSQFGNMAEVLAEDVRSEGGFQVYRRTVRFEQSPQPMVILWAFDGDGRVAGFSVQPPSATPTEAPSPYLEYTTRTPLRLPFTGEWTVFWGGRTVAENYHAAHPDQRFAYDLLVTVDGARHRGEGRTNEDYYCWGRPIVAPAAGTVVTARDGLPDNVPGQMDPTVPPGNHVVIDHGQDEFSFLAHLREGSVRVAAGDRVAPGDTLGVCGNSGNSSEPHLHYHLQDTPDFGRGDGKPSFFRDYIADGVPVEVGEPVQGQRIRPAAGDAPARGGAAPAAAAPAASPAAPDAAPAGRWEGVFGTTPYLSPITVDLAAAAGGGWSGTFALPAEGVDGFPIQDVALRGDSLVLTFRGGANAVVLQGRLEGGALVGTFETPAGSSPAHLARAGSDEAARLAGELEEAREAARERALEQVGPAPARDAVDAAALERLLAAARAANSDAVVVLRDGEVVGAWYALGQRRLIEAMSATKSIVNLAVGRLVSDGLLESLDTPVHTCFPEWSTGEKSRITVRHLLAHTSGIVADATTEAIYASDDFVRHALDSELTSSPGTEIFYNNSATNLLAGFVGCTAGAPLDMYLRDGLFAELGITDFAWTRDAAGNPHGMSGLQIAPLDLARLGQFVLQRGEWDGRQLIDAAWFDVSLRPGSELSDGVGLLWWLIRDPGPDGTPGAGPIVGYRADGYLGQYLVIYPAERLVGVRMVAASPVYDPDTDGFRDFQELLRQLVPEGSASGSPQ